MHWASFISFVPRSWLLLLFASVTTLISCTEDSTSTIFTASFSVTENPLVNQQVTFTNTSTRGTSFEWDFGDGNMSTLENPTHIYSSGGAFIVTLTVFAGKAEEISSQTISVLELPTAAFTLPEGTFYNAIPIEFTNTSNAATSHAWSFGDSEGSTSTKQHPNFLYDQEGTYTVSLETSNAAGTAIFSQEITVCDFYLVGTYDITSDLSDFCESNFSGTIDIIHDGGGLYSFNDWSFGGYETCYEVNFGLTGTFKIKEECGIVTLNRGNDAFGDPWDILLAISGNDLIVNWDNRKVNSIEQGITTITFPNGVPFQLGNPSSF